MTPDSTWTRFRHLLLPVGLVLMILATYLPVLQGTFLSYDDTLNIVGNPRLADFSPANLLFFWQKPFDHLYIPITYTIWGFLAATSRFLAPSGSALIPGLFHGANLFIHVTNALLVMAILRGLGLRGKNAWAGAAIFALHPVQVEAVAWATGLKDLLSSLFILLSIRLYMKFIHCGQGGIPRQAVLYSAMALALLAAMLSKPGAAVAPLLLLIIGRFALGRTWRRLGAEIIPLAILVMPFVILTKLAQPDSRHLWIPELWQRLLISCSSLAFYTKKILLPLSLGPDYGLTFRQVLADGPELVVGIIFLLMILGLGLWLGDRWRLAALFFIAALLPVSGLFLFDFQNISTVADRYLYLAMLGPALAVAHVLGLGSGRLWRWAVLFLLIVVLSGLSFLQAGTWADDRIFVEHALAINPNSWVMRNNLGILKAGEGKYDGAEKAFDHALAVNPLYAEAHNNLGSLARAQGRNQLAITHFQKALAINPQDSKASFRLAEIYASQGKELDAIASYRQALAADPDFIEAANNLALLHLKRNNPTQARDLLLRAIAAGPPNPLLYTNLARVYLAIGDRQEADQALGMAREISGAQHP